MPLPDIPAGIEARANAAFTEFSDSVDVIQPGYFSTNGRYWQGIVGDVPHDGANATPNPTAKPTDQAESYAGVGLTFPSNSPIAVGVDVYEGPDGSGYIIFGEITIAGKLWRKQEDRGSSGRTYDWRELNADG